MENLDRKKFFYGLAGIVLLVILGFIAYQYFSPGAKTPRDAKESVTGRLPEVPGADGVPEISLGGGQFSELKPGEEAKTDTGQTIFRITDFPVVSPSLNKSGDKILFYKKSGGDLISSDFTGKEQVKISNITIVGMLEALWSPKRDRAAVFYLDEETKKGFMHNATDSSVAVLPQNIESFSWSPTGNSVAYLLDDGESIKLTIADSLNKNARVVFRTPILDSTIQWVASDKIIFEQAASGLAEGFMFQYSLSSEIFSKILGGLYGLSSVWSPDGNKMLESHTAFNGKRPAVSLRTRSGEATLAVGATLAEKCAFAGNNAAYCAVPSFIPQAWTLPDDYYRGEVGTSDSLLYIDADKNAVSSVLSDIGFDMAHLTTTQDKSWIFFVNKTDGSLWGIRLK